MGALSPLHLIIILVIALLILGPGKLPETGAALGRAIQEFRHAVDGKAEAAIEPSHGVGQVTASRTQPGPSASDGAVGGDSSRTDPA